ncbi:MAG: N-acetyltransferase [Anaeroplasmataceae bacterium]|nr:N-acetyltransferase [Anaeroplasmataceae bacterium]
MLVQKEKNRISFLEDGKELAFISFPDIDPKTVVIKTTYVDDTLRGQGIAKKLMEEAYLVIKSSNRKAILECSYAIEYFRKNIEKQDIVQSCPYTSVG